MSYFINPAGNASKLPNRPTLMKTGTAKPIGGSLGVPYIVVRAANNPVLMPASYSQFSKGEDEGVGRNQFGSNLLDLTPGHTKIREGNYTVPFDTAYQTQTSQTREGSYDL